MVKANGKDMITLNYDPLCLELWEKTILEPKTQKTVSLKKKSTIINHI